MTPLPPQEVINDLRAIDPRFGLRWVGLPTGGYFALTKAWEERDPRRERMRSGELPRGSAFDIEHMFPHDCPTGEMAAYVRARYGPRNADNAAEQARRVGDAQVAQNAKAVDVALEAFDALSEQKVKDDTDHQRRLVAGADTAHPMVHGFGPSKRRKKDEPASPAGGAA